MLVKIVFSLVILFSVVTWICGDDEVVVTDEDYAAGNKTISGEVDVSGGSNPLTSLIKFLFRET